MSWIITRKVNVNAIAGYLLTGAVCILYALFVDIRFGLTFLLVFMIAPLVSIGMTGLAVKRLTVDACVSNTLMNKGNTVDLDVSIRTDSPVPIPFLRVALWDSPRLYAEGKDSVVMALSRASARVFSKRYRALIWGVVRVGVKSLEAVDFLGLCIFEIQPASGEPLYTKYIEVLPDIPEIGGNPLLREAIDACTLDDEEEAAERSILRSGMPGYEHRMYVPGDPLKKINWKLSSKYNEYMVRLDEPIASPKQAIVLDCLGAPEALTNEIALREEERLVEAVLAMLSLMVKQYIQCNVYCLMRGKWQSFLIKNENDLAAFQYGLAGYNWIRNPSAVSSRIPQAALDRSDVMMVFSASLDSALISQIDAVRQTKIQVKAIVSQNRPYETSDVWRVDSMFEFIAV